MEKLLCYAIDIRSRFGPEPGSAPRHLVSETTVLHFQSAARAIHTDEQALNLSAAAAPPGK